MKIANLDIPVELEQLVAGRSEKDLDGLAEWVRKAWDAGIDHTAMRATLVGSGWAELVVDWYLGATAPAAGSQPAPTAHAGQPSPAQAPPSVLAKRVLGFIACIALFLVVWRLNTPPSPDGGVAKLLTTSRSGQGSFAAKPAQSEMILIRAGEFIMGGSASDESPRRKVYLDAYRISKNLVTVGQFRAYCAAIGIDFSTFPVPSWGWIDVHPMVNVSWQQARDYCRWAGGDLPTEAQWEKAARGTDGREYPWGNEWDASRCRNSADSTAPAGTYPTGASPYGCLDMAGNVWEWCLDWYADNHAGQPNRNPKGPGTGTWRVLRGGSWGSSNHEFFHSAYRFSIDPAGQSSDGGFRLAGPP